MKPLISIITITYNSQSTLEETILSVLSQDYANLEYIIVDGGSTDGTLDIIRKYDAQISKWISEPDKGISDAFNKGIAMASGEIIGIINSDDILLPEAVHNVVEYYDPTIDVYSGNVLFWDDKSGKTMVSKPDLDFGKLRLQYGVAHPSRFVTKKAYDSFGVFDVRLRYNMDVDLLCRLYRGGARFVHIDKALTKFRMGATTADPIFKKKDDYRIFVENYGGTKTDFRKIWTRAIVKYRFIQLSYFIFGKDFRYQLSNSRILNKTLLPIIKKLFD